MKKVTKYLIASIFYLTGLTALRLQRRFKRNPGLILMYHRVLADDDPECGKIQPGMFVKAGAFEKQIAYLAKKYEIISLGELARMLDDPASISGKYVIVTFDDGWRDNFEIAYPILMKYNVPATIFLTTGFIESTDVLWFYQAENILRTANISAERAAAIISEAVAASGSAKSPRAAPLDNPVRTRPGINELIEMMKELDAVSIESVLAKIAAEGSISGDVLRADNRMLNWDQITQMKRAGIEFGSHGVSHAILTRMRPDEVMDELVNSKDSIKSRLGIDVSLFSYPNGNYDPEIRNMARGAGYKCSVTTRGNPSDHNEIDTFALRRTAIHQDISLGPRGSFSKIMFAFHLAAWKEIFRL